MKHSGKPAERPTYTPADQPAEKPIDRWENEGGQPHQSQAATPSTPQRPVKKMKIERPDSPPPVPPDRGNQRRADARAKDSRIKQAGTESRMLGHVSGSGKRNQARRDSKNG